MTAVSIVIPNWNGRRWLPGCLGSLARQHLAPAEVIVVDNGSSDGSLAYLGAEHPGVRVIALATNTGFAHAANLGIAAAGHEFVSLVNTDVELEPDWLERMVAALVAEPQAASVTGKMVELDRPDVVYDAGDVLRRDGQCLQRGRFGAAPGRFETPGEVFGACAGAALYRRSALTQVGGFDERFFAYLEDVDLALRLRLAGWGCRYEPAIAHHAGEGSSGQLVQTAAYFVQRNTLMLVVKAFPVRWLPFVLYRQLALARLAWREKRLRVHLRATAVALWRGPSLLPERRRLRMTARVPVETVVPARRLRGPDAGGHASGHAAPPVGQR